MSTTTTSTTEAPTQPTMAGEAPILGRKGNLILRPMLPRDIAAYIRMNDAAFANALQRVFFPNGKTEADWAWQTQQTRLSMVRDAGYITRLVVIDTAASPKTSDVAGLSAAERLAAQDEGLLVGSSTWKTYPRDRTQAEIDEEDLHQKEDGFPPAMNKAAIEGLIEAVGHAKEKHIGNRAHVLLHILATDPEYHRKGVGSLHLEWGIKEMERLGVIGYLEGSEKGRPLYARFGFEEKELVPFDATKFYDGPEIPHTVMVRPVKAST